jgi:dolichyl-phosphate beta-glucosyltransferase
VRVTVVVPCYNEEQRLPVEIFRTFAAPQSQVRFLFVNDGSRDGTMRVLDALRSSDPSRFAVLDLEKNSGKAEAVRRGMVEAMKGDAEVVGFWDADLATPLSEIPLFLDIFEQRRDTTMVFASRVRLLGRDISRRATRHYFGRVGATLISTTLGIAVYDTQCGAKLFRVNDTLREIFSKPFLSRWIFDVEVIARLIELRGRADAAKALYELPIREWHDVKGSKIKGTDFFKALRDLWRIRRAYKL